MDRMPLNTKPLTAAQYRALADATRKLSKLCIDPMVGTQYLQLAKLYDEIAVRLEPLSWAFQGKGVETPAAA